MYVHKHGQKGVSQPPSSDFSPRPCLEVVIVFFCSRKRNFKFTRRQSPLTTVAAARLQYNVTHTRIRVDTDFVLFNDYDNYVL